MTLTRLNNLKNLKIEEKVLLERIDEIMARATSCTANYDKVGGGCTGVSDKVGTGAVELAELTSKLDAHRQKVLTEINDVTNFVLSCNDTQIRTIMMLKYLSNNDVTWVQVAMRMGYPSESTPRSMLTRYLKGR